MKKLWTKFKYRGDTWKVWLADAKYFKAIGEDGTEGVCYQKTAEILILSDLAPGRRAYVLAHELGHVAFTEHTTDSIDAMIGADGADTSVDVEERICGILLPGIMDVFMAAGMIKLPKAPK